jgi:fatty-acid desaturase
MLDSEHVCLPIGRPAGHEMRLKRDKTFTQPIVWLTTFFVIAFHIGAAAALFNFSWKAFVLAILLWWVAGGLGIGMGFHRLLTHRGYKTQKLVEQRLLREGNHGIQIGFHKRGQVRAIYSLHYLSGKLTCD